MNELCDSTLFFLRISIEKESSKCKTLVRCLLLYSISKSFNWDFFSFSLKAASYKINQLTFSQSRK